MFSSPNNPEHELPLLPSRRSGIVCCSRSALPKQGIDIVNMRVLDAIKLLKRLRSQRIE